MKTIPPKRAKLYREGSIRIGTGRRIEKLSEYFEVLDAFVTGDEKFWFRGHSDHTWTLTPSALRPPKKKERIAAFALVDEFKRYAEIKLPKPPAHNEDMKWVQLAQHYGLPTRLLDWSENAVVALYFSCAEESHDGMVVVLNPIDLNRMNKRAGARILDAHRDRALILEYLRLTAATNTNGSPPLAVHPIQNSDRVVLQQGVFTLYGTRPKLDSAHVPSLIGIPILQECKPQLLLQLERIGVHEMSLFPEIEHTCNYLKGRSGRC